MDVPDTTGKTNRQQLEYIYKQTGIKPELLDEDVEISPNEKQFLNLFWRIYQTRSSAERLTLSDITSWSTAYNIPIAPLELDYLIALGQIVAAEMNKSNKG